MLLQNRPPSPSPSPSRARLCQPPPSILVPVLPSPSLASCLPRAPPTTLPACSLIVNFNRSRSRRRCFGTFNYRQGHQLYATAFFNPSTLSILTPCFVALPPEAGSCSIPHRDTDSYSSFVCKDPSENIQTINHINNLFRDTAVLGESVVWRRELFVRCRQCSTSHNLLSQYFISESSHLPIHSCAESLSIFPSHPS